MRHMWKNGGLILVLVVLLVARPLVAADAKEIKLEPGQQKAVDALRAKGAAVMQIAADTDAMAVNLGIVGKQATDAELEQVKQLPKVTQLDLHNTGITDAGLANLSGMTSLTHLHLNGTAITDAGLKSLKGLTSLQYLNLYNTAVTDAGLKELSGMKELQRLYVWQTKVTEDGAKAIKAELPKVMVNRGEELTVVPPPAPAADDAAAKKKATAAVDKKPINDKCPVTGDPIEAANTLVYEGKTVAFCCDNCPKAFEKNPAKYLVNLPELKAAPAATPAPAKAKGKAKGKGKAKAAAAIPDIDEEGYIRTWLVLGPIALEGAAAEEIAATQIDAEAELQPKAGEKVKVGDKEFAWQKVQAKDSAIDFNALLKSEDQVNVAVYAVAYVESPEEIKDVTLMTGTNDQGRVYFNGKEMSTVTESRSLIQDSEKAEGLTLKKGVNTVVVKVINESNNWEACARFVDAEGNAIKGLKIKATP